MSELNDIDQFSEAFVKHLFDTAFDGVQSRTEKIGIEQSNLENKIDSLTKSVNEQTEIQGDFQKCVTYYEKAKNLRRDFIILNERCIDLKKRALQLKEENESTKKIIQIEQEPTVVAPTVYKIIKTKNKPRQIAEIAEITEKEN